MQLLSLSDFAQTTVLAEPSLRDGVALGAGGLLLLMLPYLLALHQRQLGRARRVRRDQRMVYRARHGAPEEPLFGGLRFVLAIALVCVILFLVVGAG